MAMSKAGVGFLVIMLVIAVSIVILATAGVDFGIGGGYKVVVSGEVTKDALYGGYHCTVGADYYPDPGIFSIKPAWFWDSKSVTVTAELTGSDGSHYKSETSLGSVNLFTGGSLSYSIDIRHVPVGDYVGVVTVYEIDKSLFGMGWETSRSSMTSKSFSLIITEVEW